jgi:hypothetical protein
VSDWHWEVHPDDLLEGLPAESREQVDQIARELVVRDSMVYLDGKHYEGLGPGLRTERRPNLLLTYLTDVRGERVVLLQVTWLG